MEQLVADLQTQQPAEMQQAQYTLEQLAYFQQMLQASQAPQTEPEAEMQQSPAEEVMTQTTVDNAPSADENQNNQVESKFDWENAINEVESLLKEPTNIREEKPVEEAAPTPEEQELFKTKYEEELGKRVAIQSEKAELEAMVKYQQSLLDKQSDKHLTIIERQKDLESELRRAKSTQTPEAVSPLSQAYQLYKESGTPVHKYRFLNAALELLQNEFGIS